MKFREEVKRRRTLLNMTQKTFAARLGVPKGVYVTWELGVVKRPRAGSKFAESLLREGFTLRPALRPSCRSRPVVNAPLWSRQIREIRVERNLSLPDLSALLGVSIASIIDWEHGRYMPDPRNAYYHELVSMGVVFVDNKQAAAHDKARPKKRSECPPMVEGSRSCPWFMCRHHIAFDVAKTGRLISTHNPDRTFDCSFDAVEAHPSGMTLEEVGAEFAVTRERIRQIEEEAIRAMLETAPDLIEWLTRSVGDGRAKRGAYSLSSLS